MAERLRVSVAQFPVTLDIESNLAHLREVVRCCEKSDLLVLPEGVLSGYDHDLAFLDERRREHLDAAIAEAAGLAKAADIHLIVGSCLFEERHWYNGAVCLAPDGGRFFYRKINLAHHERGFFRAGDHLDVWHITSRGLPLKVGLQLCREIRFPEQWRVLAQRGVQIFAFLSNAVGDLDLLPVWRSHLISRAAETQRFVLAANSAAHDQKCPTMIVHPNGRVLAEIASDGVEVLSAEIDPSAVSSWYIDQARQDVVAVRGGAS